MHAAYTAHVQFMDSVSSQVQSLPSQVHTAETYRQVTDLVKQHTQQSGHEPVIAITRGSTLRKQEVNPEHVPTWCWRLRRQSSRGWQGD